MSKIGDYFASQCGNPHGIMGAILTKSMNKANRVLYDGIVEQIELSDSSRVLDIGFGNGFLESLIMQKTRCNITGIDISEDMVQRANHIYHKYIESGNMSFKLGDCCNLEFPDETFDAVTTINTIYFWNDTFKGLKEINRVLKPGGVFYNAVLEKDTLDKFFYTKNGFKKFATEEYIELGKEASFCNVWAKELGHQYGLLITYRKEA